LEVADMLARIVANYEREGAGPGSRFEGRLLEDVQAEAVIRHLGRQPFAPGRHQGGRSIADVQTG
jgi:hypothetical protein